ncbi:MAG TPA: hypothetical protein VL307_16645 [Chitinophagaceae bacterium]|nr:hypothetical protein [Chitinophagaceae bacterium]
MAAYLRVQKTFISLLVLHLTVLSVLGQTQWPVTIPATGGSSITVYEPQPEKYADNNLYARAAVSIIKKAGAEPVFGVMWFNASITNRAGIGVVNTVTVPVARFADNDTESKTILSKAVEKEWPGMNISFDVNRLATALQNEQEEEGANVKNDPPLIIYRDKPSTLIVLDGEPVEQMDDDLAMTRVVNSPYLIVKNPSDKRYYLYGGNLWYSSSNVKDGWAYVQKLPAALRSVDAVMKEEAKKDTAQKDAGSFTKATSIVVATEPAELIQTEGPPSYQAVEGSTLLYVNNSLDEIFKDIESQKNFILIAGRWYNSSSLNGPWTYVAPDQLPAAFANIPAGSEKDGVLASVAGTQEANDAMIEARVPQTAKVDRQLASTEVTYDGAPQFVPIENTQLQLAENANITVMRAPNNQYYALENGIWFISNNPQGPWKVANERPADVEKIPASSTAYNARYVYVYQSTPRYVYVGYTPGYMGNYICRTTVVWGTGWRYRPWYGRRFWPRPYTWGFGMHYNPWVGWSISFGLGFNNAWYRYRNQHLWGCGWFGPPRYRPPYRPWGWNGGYYGNRPIGYRPVLRPAVTYNRPPNWNRPQPQRPQRTYNMYNRRRDVVATRDIVQRPIARPAELPGVDRPMRPGARPSPGDNGRPTVTRPLPTPERPLTRPVSPGDNGRPVNRPFPSPERPVTRPVTRPIDNNRPITRPAPSPERPLTRPVTRPVIPPVNENRPQARPRPIERTRPLPRPARQANEDGNQRRPVRRPVKDN